MRSNLFFSERWTNPSPTTFQHMEHHTSNRTSVQFRTRALILKNSVNNSQSMIPGSDNSTSVFSFTSLSISFLQRIVVKFKAVKGSVCPFPESSQQVAIFTKRSATILRYPQPWILHWNVKLKLFRESISILNYFDWSFSFSFGYSTGTDQNQPWPSHSPVSQRCLCSSPESSWCSASRISSDLLLHTETLRLVGGTGKATAWTWLGTFAFALTAQE